jgi:hypothetical protein
MTGLHSKRLLALSFLAIGILASACGGSADPSPPAGTYTIAGTVTNSSSVTVSLSGAATAQTTTSASGTYSFTGLAAGSYLVTPTKTGYSFSPASRSVTLAADSAGNDFAASALPSNVTLTATFSDPPPTVTSAGYSGALATAASTVWTGYQLSCVTFGTPPVAASGTADATGRVSVTMAVQNVAFGCFVLDATGKAVATLFVTSGAQSSQTIMMSTNADMGTVTVNLSLGTAFAALPGGITLVTTTPSGAACPLGTWAFVQASDSGCGTVKGEGWIAQFSTGPFLSSMTIHNLHVGGACLGSYSLPGTPTVKDGAAYVLGPFAGDPGCPGKLNSLRLTPDATCRTAVGIMTETYCPASCSCGHTETLAFTRQ